MTRVYNEITKFSNDFWAIKDLYELYRVQGNKRRTRRHVTDENKQESKEWQENSNAQYGYGEITPVSDKQYSGSIEVNTVWFFDCRVPCRLY